MELKYLFASRRLEPGEKLPEGWITRPCCECGEPVMLEPLDIPHMEERGQRLVCPPCVGVMLGKADRWAMRRPGPGDEGKLSVMTEIARIAAATKAAETNGEN